MKATGKVYLVGAGPGDAGLLTLRGAELLGRADVVVYDALVNPDLLRLASKSAEVIYAGKRSRHHALPQEELNALLVRKAKEGKRVVRLKGGDPYIFGRGGEEAEELAGAHVPFEVVPGISSIVAGPNYAGIPLTHRDHCSCFTVLTGHEDPTKGTSSLDYEQLARLPGTKVILMGVERIGPIAQELVAHGMASDTPVGMVRWGTTERQQSLEGTLGTIADLVQKAGFTAPAVTVIGDVVKLRKKLNWFEKRPLFNKRIVVTRTREQASALSGTLRELGAEVLEIPTIRIEPPDEKEPLIDALLGLNAYDWLVFTSPNGVASFFDYFFKTFQDLRGIGGVRIAAVGPSTEAKLKELHLKIDVVPSRALTSELPAALAASESLENLAILLVRAQKATLSSPRHWKPWAPSWTMWPATKPFRKQKTGMALLRDSLNPAPTGSLSRAVRQWRTSMQVDLPKILTRFPKSGWPLLAPKPARAWSTWASNRPWRPRGTPSMAWWQHCLPGNNWPTQVPCFGCPVWQGEAM